MLHPTIEQYMTRAPHTIGHDQTLATAHRLMRANDIRHLPVLDRGRLVGIVSQRDLHLLETLKGVDQDEVTVAEAMTADVLSAEPSLSLHDAAEQMAHRRAGCLVVTRADRVVGIFTAIDALSALVALTRS